LLFFHVGELVVSTTTASLALVLVYLYWLGLKHCKTEGKPILKAIVVIWSAVAMLEVKATMIEIMSVYDHALDFGDMHYLVRLPFQLMLLISAVYFIRATLKRNPPEMIDETDAVRRSLDRQE